MNPLPTLPASFYDQTPQLTHIRRAAQAFRTPPDTVLASVLTRVAATVPPAARVNRDSPNYIAALVGHSGSGKSKSARCARELLPQIGTELDGWPVSSGEGLVQAYLRTEKVDGQLVQIQHHTAGLFHVDEGQQLLAVADRQGSTTFSLLRNMWVGETAGTTGARSETTRRLQHGRYRFAMTVGLQPDYAAQLLNDHHAGTPQRFLWTAARDPDPPPTCPKWPGELPMPTVVSCDVRIGSQVQRVIDDAERRSLIDGGTPDPLRSHETLLTMRTGYLLAVLHGRPGELDGDDWVLGLQLVEHSRSVVEALQQIAVTRRREQNAEQDREQVERQQHRADLTRQRDIERVARHIARHLHNHGPQRGPELRQKVAHRDRHLFDDAARHGISVGLFSVDGDKVIAGPVKP